jgi:hypothetical protein
VTAAGGQEAGQQPTRGQRVAEVAVAGRVHAGTALAVAKQAPGGVEPKRGLLAEHGHAVAVDAIAQRFAYRPVGGVTGHQPHRQLRARGALPVLLLRQPGIQEGRPRQSLDQRLDDAPHARRHASRQHHQRELAARKRCLAQRGQTSRFGGLTVGQVGDIAGCRRGHLTAHPVHVRAGVQQALGPAAKPLRVEAGGVELLGQRRVESRQVAIQAGIRQTGRAAG